MSLRELGSSSGGEKEKTLGLWWESNGDMCEREQERMREERTCMQSQVTVKMMLPVFC